MRTSTSNLGSGWKISLAICSPSNSRSWRDEHSSRTGQNTTVEEVMIQAAQQVASEVRRYVKNALFGPQAEIRGDLSYIDGRFWSATEPIFYTLLRRTRDAINTGEDVTPL